MQGGTIPTLLIAGARDRIIPPNQSVELYQAVAADGVPAELVIYTEDGHSLRGFSAHPDTAARILDWLVRYVDVPKARSPE